MTDLGRHAGRDDEDRSRAAGDLRVHEREVDAIAQRRVVGDGIDLLGDRDALAGQRRLVDLERGGAEDPRVRGDEVAGLDVDDVAGHQVAHRQLDEIPVATRLGLDDHHLLERGHARGGLALLAEAHRRVQERQGDEDHAGRDLVRDEQAQDAGRQQHDLHRVLVLAHEGLPARLLGRLGELVRAVLRPSRFGFGAGQASLRGDALPFECRGGGQAVPGGSRIGGANVTLRHREPS